MPTVRLLTLADRFDRALLQQVFTHGAWAATHNDSYERLEFLGDSVLSLCVTTELFRRFPDLTEGQLARLRAYVVSRSTCAKVALKLGLAERLRECGHQRCDHGELTQLQENDNVLADLVEALIGAVYLAYGFETVRPAVIAVFAEHISYAVRSYIDYKTELQEFLARSSQVVKYQLEESSGPAHNRQFAVAALVAGKVVGRGSGTSKKRAEQAAAGEALAALRPAPQARPRSAPVAETP